LNGLEKKLKAHLKTLGKLRGLLVCFGLSSVQRVMRYCIFGEDKLSGDGPICSQFPNFSLILDEESLNGKDVA